MIEVVDQHVNKITTPSKFVENLLVAVKHLKYCCNCTYFSPPVVVFPYRTFSVRRMDITRTLSYQ